MGLLAGTLPERDERVANPVDDDESNRGTADSASAASDDTSALPSAVGAGESVDDKRAGERPYWPLTAVTERFG